MLRKSLEYPPGIQWIMGVFTFNALPSDQSPPLAPQTNGYVMFIFSKEVLSFHCITAHHTNLALERIDMMHMYQRKELKSQIANTIYCKNQKIQFYEVLLP